jgi:hypothetical protein
MATAVPLDLPTVPLPEPATLSAEDAAYLRSFAAFCEEEEARERADIDAGRHPLQGESPHGSISMAGAVV